MNAMTPAQVAALDQASAKERDFENKMARIAIVVIWLGFSLGVYSFLGIRGDVPLPSWSPVGQYQQQMEDDSQPKPVPDSSRNVTSI